MALYIRNKVRESSRGLIAGSIFNTTLNEYSIINIFCLQLVLFALAAVALSQDRYPAGLHPAVCPNYPYCAADALARHTPGGQPIPQWQYPAAAYAAAA